VTFWYTLTKDLYEQQENYVSLIEDTLDELAELFNFKQEDSYLDQNSILDEERSRLYRRRFLEVSKLLYKI